MLATWGCLWAVSALAVDVGLAGTLGSKALLVVDGSEPRAVMVGQTVDGVKLLSVSGDQAVVEVEGKKRPLRVGQHAMGGGGGDGGKVVIALDRNGQFLTNGSINGAPVRFLVDTGASMISLGTTDARRLALDPEKGQRGTTITANGRATVWKVKLDSVQVGDITLHNVDAVIQQTDMPFALLGMSFLNRMEMLRDGDTMTLKRRY